MIIKRMIKSVFIAMCLSILATVGVSAAEFDPVYYANAYPGVVSVLGNSPEALYNHYIIYGMKEGRCPYAGAVKGESVSGIKNIGVNNTNTIQTGVFTPVTMNKLANLSSIKKKMNDAEFSQAYNAALEIVMPLAGLSREEQLRGISQALRNRCESNFAYSTSTSHYNDPYGYFIEGSASCAGCARATGLCLNILGIPYEHVNENKWNHQWCRINVNGTYWICDAFGLYCAPEPAPYAHPLAD